MAIKDEFLLVQKNSMPKHFPSCHTFLIKLFHTLHSKDFKRGHEMWLEVEQKETYAVTEKFGKILENTNLKKKKTGIICQGNCHS